MTFAVYCGLKATNNQTDHINLKFQKQLSLGDLPDQPPIMTSEEILLCYWKISVSIV